MCQFAELKVFNVVVRELISANFQENETTGCMLNSIWEDFSVALSNKITRQDTNEKLSIFIRLVQNNLTEFADDLYKFYQRSGFTVRIKNLFKKIFFDIIDMLACYKDNYAEFFNIYDEVPVGLITLNETSRMAHRRITQSLNEMNIDPKLIAIVDQYIKSLYTFNSFHSLSWYQYAFLIKMCEKIILFVEHKNDQEDTGNLIKLLITHNFNVVEFYDYLLDKYTKRLSDPGLSYEDQELELLHLLRSAKTISPRSDSGYDRKAPPISVSICESIHHEIDLISKLKTVSSLDPPNAVNSKTSNYYFDVSVTVEELFFLIKVMLEVRFIKTKFKSSLYSFVSKHIRTDRTTSPSERYMRNILAPKHQVPVKIIRKIRSWLTSMVNYIDTNYKNELKLSLFLAVSTFKVIQNVGDVFS